ncbi:MAG: tetratricopeptide (TPR) repeat protein [Bacteriovoracaceae bacterium]|jgi:tetratricopeptide (TPR) repeat protein
MCKLLVLLILSINFVSHANDEIDKRRLQIIKIIDEELGEVSRLDRQKNGRDPDLLLRMAELNLEKARLYREKENEAFLDIPSKKRSKVSQKKFFSQSSRYFSEANQLCVNITRKFSKYKRMGEVYYILGFNAKEANNPKKAKRYLTLANKKASDGFTQVKTQISLAEIYYNNKKYRKAIPLYEKALSKHKDKWWTKDSFNLAWCYFRSNQFSKAISKMKEVFSNSSKSKYIDMRAQVERDIGLFYATSDRITEGVKFYKKIGINFTDQLLRIAQSLLTQGKFDKANKVLNHAGKYEKRTSKIIEINIEKINLYLKFGKYALHHQISKRLFSNFKKNELSKNQTKTFQFQLEKIAATLQRQVVGKTYRRLKAQRRVKAQQAIAYFDMLAEIDNNRSEEFKFLKGETAYAANFYSESYTYYREAFIHGEKSKSSKFKVKSMDSMLVVLSRLKNSNDKNIYVFEAYLRNWPRGKRSKDIYGRLFNNYMAMKDYGKAKSVLDRFVKVYPKDKTQEVMIAKLMDVSRKKNDNGRIRVWISDIDKGLYTVSGKYKRKLQELLTTLQIEDVQAQLNKGNKKIALVGYLDILNDKFSTKRSKINAKYNLAALYYELNDTDNSYKWSIEAMAEMGSNDVLKFSGSFITIANFLFTSLEFSKSANLSYYFVNKVCKLKSKKKDTAFKNGAFIYLADGLVKEAEKLASLGAKCRIKSYIREEVDYEIMREYFNKKDWNRYEYYALKLQNSSRYYPKVIDDFLNLVNIHKKFENSDKVKRFRQVATKLYYKAKKARKIVSLRGLDYFASIHVKEMEELVGRKNLLRFSSINSFKKDYDRKFSLLQKLEKKAQDVLEIGSGKGIVNAYRILYENYQSFAIELETVEPTGLKKEHLGAFRKDLGSPIKASKIAAATYKREAVKSIKNNSILNQNNFYFQDNPIPTKYFGDNDAVLMDRGGR